jgi:hypothetical protein
MKRLLLITSLCMLFASTTVFAYPTQVSYNDGPQDPLAIPVEVHELGTAPTFDSYPDEKIFADSSFDDITVCFDTSPTNIPDDPLVPNAIVRIINLTGIAWQELWYVADEETYHSNYDGWATDNAISLGTAFRIDRLANDPGGVHHPLISETLTPDGIFEVGEGWEFVIQDYTNTLGFAASALGSIGLPSVDLVGISDLSSGSIIAVPVPEPVTIGLLSLGALILRHRKRKI